MAEIALVAMPIAQSLLHQLRSPPFSYILHACHFKKDLRRLEQTIQTITDFLHSVQERRSNDRMLQGWLFRLKAVLLDAENLFEVVSSRTLRKKTMHGNPFKTEVSLFFSKSNQLYFIYSTTRDVKDLRERLDDIAKDMSLFPYPMRQENYTRRILDRKETHSFVNVNDVIGRDAEKEDIIKMLLPEDHGGQEPNLSVIAIIGFGGLGKTTLAQIVYNDERVKVGFVLRLWACVNYFSDLKEVLMTILAPILRIEPHENNLEHLQGEFRRIIQGQKYLLVLDDVWDEESVNWRALKSLLECGGSGSKVLATSHKVRVARCLDSIEPYYQLNGLSEESALSLFFKATFKEGDELSNDHEWLQLGKKIATKCGYVPLALISIGSMLRSKKKEKTTWSSIIEKEFPEVLSDGVEGSEIMRVLMFSYNDLPLALKYCFAYCSLFPKDYTYDKDKLVRMWLAQGFLESHAYKSMEEVGDDYFFYLVDRCFFQEVITYTRDGCLTCMCTMHGLLHDLAIHLAGNMDYKRLFEEDYTSVRVDEESSLRHISVNYHANSVFENFDTFSHSKTLRTLLFCDKRSSETPILSEVLVNFKKLHTLELSYLEIVNFPNFGELIHLRYLDLSFNSILTILPKSISKLCNLQTLNLEGCRLLRKLPSDMNKLVSLRHLVLKGCNGLAYLPSGLSTLTSLVTLDRVVVHHRLGGLRFLGHLNNLCGSMNFELPTIGWSHAIVDAKGSKLATKRRLKGMTIKWVKPSSNDTHQIVREETRTLVLQALQPNNNLQYLNIEGHVADRLSSWVFSLSYLKELILKDCTLEYLDDKLWSSHSFLPCLEVLEMNSLPNLKGWWKNMDAQVLANLPCLPNVLKLVINDCPMLMENLPLFRRVENVQLEKVNWKLFSEPLTQNTKCQNHSTLKELCLFDVRDLEALPEDSLKFLTALKSLKIELSLQLSWVSCSGLAPLTSLEKLEIFNCGNVNLVNQDGVNLVQMPWKFLQRLRVLDVPWQSHLLRGLQHLTFLEELKLCYLDNEQVEADNNNMEFRDHGFLLERLQRLTIKTVHDMCCFPEWIQYLPSLRYLNFCHCEELYMKWSVLASMKLHKLSFVWVKKVVNVDPTTTTEEQSLSNSIVQLHLDYIKEERWIHDMPWNLFSSLRTLELDSICHLNSLPEGIKHVTSLQQLSITMCSRELATRCKPETGADWHIISHIPSLEIITADDEDILVNYEMNTILSCTLDEGASNGENCR